MLLNDSVDYDMLCVYCLFVCYVMCACCLFVVVVSLCLVCVVVVGGGGVRVVSLCVCSCRVCVNGAVDVCWYVSVCGVCLCVLGFFCCPYVV